MWNRAKRIRIQGNARIWVVAVVALLEALLVGVLWARSQPKAQIAYLMKVGGRYVLAWKDTDSRFDSVVYKDLNDAVRFADENLGLHRGHNFLESADVEYLSFNDRPTGYVVQWKVINQPFLNQLTFNSQTEARYFWSSIRGGSYAPSPFGHSLLFLPKTN